MARLIEKLNIVDIEATCWDGTPPEGQSSEIIEIGLYQLDLNYRYTDKDPNKCGILIKPVNSTVSEFCTKLTTLTPYKLRNGKTLWDACTILMEQYETKEHVWASWGDYDRGMFEKQCKKLYIPYPFGSRHINLKTLFAIKHKLSKEVGVAKALEILSMKFEGTPHRGVDDAYNIARIAREIL